jgi:hypothetical protein
MEIINKYNYEQRLGETSFNTQGTLMKIIRYKSSSDITVEFQDDYLYKINTSYQNFKRRCISNPYSRSVFGVGYIGEGTHPNFVNGKNTPPYITWKDMLLRCYYEKTRQKTFSL